MKYSNNLISLAIALLFGMTTTVMAASDEEAVLQAEEKELQAQLEVEYKKALSEAERKRHAAEVSIKKAREQLHHVSKQQGEIAKEQAKEDAQAHAAQQAKMAQMHEELSHARRQLQQTQREIARVNREVSRARSEEHHLTRLTYTTIDRPVIGVILGDADDVGVKVLGVSPDGPSERAGIKQGDVIVAVGGQVLAAIKETENASDGLRVAMSDIKADEALTVTVERADTTIDLTVIPEIREPRTWHTVTRFPSAPHAMVAPGEPVDPARVVTVERIVVPEIDTAEISEKIAKIRVEIDERRELLDKGVLAPVDREYEFEFHDLSEMGNFALHDANIWFGLPLTQGLQLAEIDPGLGEYFKTDRGVLVLKARIDNELQLESGDVILRVGDTEVNSPAEFMRALRGFDSGDEVEIDIKRKRKNRTLNAIMPENRMSFFKSDNDGIHSFEFTAHTD